MMEVDQIPEAFTEERRAQLGEELPMSVTIKLSPTLAAFLYSRALTADRDYEWVARQLLELWAEKQLEVAQGLMAAIGERDLAVEKPATPARKKPEREYRDELAAAIEAHGMRCQTEFNTGAGVADIAVFADGLTKPVAIVEVKLVLNSWREVHHASGQATAYAKAAGARLWFVTAPRMDPRLLSAKVLPIAEAAAAVSAAVAAKVTA